MRPQKITKYIVVKYDTGITDFLDEKFLELIKQFLRKEESLVKITLINKRVIDCRLMLGNEEHLKRIREKFNIKDKNKPKIENSEDSEDSFCVECDKHFRTGIAIRYEHQKSEKERGFCWHNNPEYTHEICPECLHRINKAKWRN